MSLSSLNDLLSEQIQDMYDAEQQLLQALPEMASAAHTKELKMAFQEHQQETREQVSRLNRVCELLSITPGQKKCEGMAGLLREGEEIMRKQGDPAVKDAALIAAAQKVEHYEIAAYGAINAWAEQLDQDEAKDLLGKNLESEKKSDKNLTKLATGSIFHSGINREARR